MMGEVRIDLARQHPAVVRVSSAPMCYSPGVWNWFTSGALADRSTEWKCDFISAFTRGRLTRLQQEWILAGDYLTTIEGETVVITVPKPKALP